MKTCSSEIAAFRLVVRRLADLQRDRCDDRRAAEGDLRRARRAQRRRVDSRLSRARRVAPVGTRRPLRHLALKQVVHSLQQVGVSALALLLLYETSGSGEDR